MDEKLHAYHDNDDYIRHNSQLRLRTTNYTQRMHILELDKRASAQKMAQLTGER